MKQLVSIVILENDRGVLASARQAEVGRRLTGVPGVGPLLTNAYVASITNLTTFKLEETFEASIGFVPEQESSGDEVPAG